MKGILTAFGLVLCGLLWAPEKMLAQANALANIDNSFTPDSSLVVLPSSKTNFSLLRLFIDSSKTSGVAQRDWGNFPKMEPARLRSLNVNGFYRFFGTYRYMPGEYEFVAGATLLDREVFIGDDTQLPNLLVNISGKSRQGFSWGMDLFAFQFLDRPGLPAYSPATPDTSRPNLDRPLESPRLGQSMLLNLGMNLYANIATPLGPLSVKLGGIHWETMTDLTMGAYTLYERYMLFDRNPWDPIGNSVFERYNRYVNEGQVDQEERWGMRAFTGAVVDLSQMPGNQSLKLMLGKNEQNGGFDIRPNAAWGGQYSWMPRTAWKFSVQTMNQRSYEDSLLLRPFGSEIHTGRIHYSTPHLSWEVEAGYSGYESVQTGRVGGLVLHTKGKWKFNKHWKVFGQAYAIDAGAVNNVGAFVNTSVTEAVVSDIPAGQAGSGALLFPTNSSLLGFGQMANNRIAADISIAYRPKNMHITAGISHGRELSAGASSISFGRPVNALTRSRFWRWGFPQNVGPYERTNLLYRNTFDQVDLTRTLEEHLHFSQLELQALYRFRLFEKAVVFNHIWRASSIQTGFDVLNTSPQAILRQYSAENEMYLHWNNRFALVFVGSGDITLGSLLTGFNVQGRPLEQYGRGYGFGFDIWAADNVCIYVRQRYFAFEDRSFLLDQYKGAETTLELKLIF